MSTIIDALLAIANSIRTLFELRIWLFEGLHWMIGMMVNGIGVLGNVLRIFPEMFVGCVVAVCGGLVVLRIFGRS